MLRPGRRTRPRSPAGVGECRYDVEERFFGCGHQRYVEASRVGGGRCATRRCRRTAESGPIGSRRSTRVHRGSAACGRCRYRGVLNVVRCGGLPLIMHALRHTDGGALRAGARVAGQVAGGTHGQRQNGPCRWRSCRENVIGLAAASGFPRGTRLRYFRPGVPARASRAAVPQARGPDNHVRPSGRSPPQVLPGSAAAVPDRHPVRVASHHVACPKNLPRIPGYSTVRPLVFHMLHSAGRRKVRNARSGPDSSGRVDALSANTGGASAVADAGTGNGAARAR